MLHELLGYLLRGIMRTLVFIGFRPKKMYVSEKAKKEFPQGPCVIVSNHISPLDGAPIEVLLPTRHIWGMTAKDLLDKSWPLKALMSFCHAIPIDRQKPSMAWLREGRKCLKQGDDVFLCPEGKCQKDRVIHPFKPGFALLAASAGVPVVPICHNGQYHFLFGKRFKMMIGEPVIMTPPPEGLSEDALNAEALQVENMIRDMQPYVMQ